MNCDTEPLNLIIPIIFKNNENLDLYTVKFPTIY